MTENKNKIDLHKNLWENLIFLTLELFHYKVRYVYVEEHDFFYNYTFYTIAIQSYPIFSRQKGINFALPKLQQTSDHSKRIIYYTYIL